MGSAYHFGADQGMREGCDFLSGVTEDDTDRAAREIVARPGPLARRIRILVLKVEVADASDAEVIAEVISGAEMLP